MLGNLIKALKCFIGSKTDREQETTTPDRPAIDSTKLTLTAKPTKEVVRVTGTVKARNKANNKLIVSINSGEQLEVLIYDTDRLTLVIGDRVSGIPTRRLDYFEPGTVRRESC